MITDFGRKSFVTWTIGLIERIKTMPDPEYICLSCGSTMQEWELWKCHNSDCDESMCPGCGGEVLTIEEYDEAQKANG